MIITRKKVISIILVLVFLITIQTKTTYSSASEQAAAYTTVENGVVTPAGGIHKFINPVTLQPLNGSQYVAGTLPGTYYATSGESELDYVGKLDNGNIITLWTCGPTNSTANNRVYTVEYRWTGVIYTIQSYTLLSNDGIVGSDYRRSKFGIYINGYMYKFTTSGLTQLYSITVYNTNDRVRLGSDDVTRFLVYGSDYTSSYYLRSSSALTSQGTMSVVVYDSTVAEVTGLNDYVHTISGSYVYQAKIIDGGITWYTTYMNDKYYAVVPMEVVDGVPYKGFSIGSSAIKDMTCHKGYYYAVLYSGEVYRSTDLTNWAYVSHLGNNGWFIESNGNVLVACYINATSSSIQKTLYSTNDGATWNYSNISTTGKLTAVDGKIFMYDGALRYTTDGYNWVTVISWVPGSGLYSNEGSIQYYGGYYRVRGSYYQTNPDDGSGWYTTYEFLSTDLVSWTSYSTDGYSGTTPPGGYMPSNVYISELSSGRQYTIVHPGNGKRDITTTNPAESYSLTMAGNIKIVNNRIIFFGGALAGTGYFINKNVPPNILVNSGSMVVGVSGNVVLSGTASDENGDSVVVSAMIGGKSKSTSFVGSGAWTLIWNVASDGIANGIYSNITVTATDSKGSSSSTTYNGSITVDTIPPAAPGIYFHN